MCFPLSPRAHTADPPLSLYASGKYSDLTIRCGYRTYSVHKAIVCSQSQYFDSACSLGFKEAVTGVIDLSEDDEEAIEHMIEYFYHNDYLLDGTQRLALNLPIRDKRQQRRKLDFSNISDPLLSQAGDNSYAAAALPVTPESPSKGKPRRRSSVRKRPRTPPPSSSYTPPVTPGDYFSVQPRSGHEEDEEYLQSNAVLHAQMYALADKFGIESLKQLAKQKFESETKAYWNDEDFCEAIQEVYETTTDSDRGLRDIILDTFKTHPTLPYKQEVAAIIRDNPLLYADFKRLNGIPIR